MQNLVKDSIRNLLLFALLMGGGTLHAQKIFHVIIKIPPSMESKAFAISYDNGVTQQNIADSFINNELNFEGSFGSEYATLDIKYKMNNSTSYDGIYFINTKPTKFIFSDADSSIDKNPFHNCKINNAIDIYQSDIRNRLVDYSKDEINDVSVFMSTNAKQIGRVDSVRRKRDEVLHKLNERQLEFIKNDPNEYFSFWWFRTQIVLVSKIVYGDDSVQVKHLLQIMNTVFSKRFTSTAEGLTLRNHLNGRPSVKKNKMAPHFESEDIQNKLVRLEDFRGQYVLLDFWGTWCTPCMREIPFLKEIRQKYSPEKLAMISISTDNDYNKLLSVVKEKDMNWIHIFNKEKLPELYSITSYPTLILINKKGVIIYNGKSQGRDELLKALQEM